MFAKIMKLEIRETWAMCLVLLALGLLGAVAGATLALAGKGFLTAMGMFLGFLSAIAFPLGLFIWLSWRYYQTMYGRRAYFTHTLPTGGGTILGAKALCFFIGTFVAIVVAAVAALTMGLTAAVLGKPVANETFVHRLGALRDALGYVFDGGPAIGYPLTFGLLALAALQWVLMVVAMSALANTRRFTKFGVGGAFTLSAIIVWFAYEVVLVIFALVIPAGLLQVVETTPEGKGVLKWQFVTGVMTDLLTGSSVAIGENATSTGVVPIGIFIAPVLLIVMYLLSHRQLTRHLNLR